MSDITKEAAKEWITKTCGEGRLNLVDIIYDNKPENIEITMVFNKWAGLKVDFIGKDVIFEELLETIYSISEKMCTICGKSGRRVVIGGVETTLCDQHYNSIEGKEKYRAEK
ncbi:MAG: hypothetical protein Q8M29_09905 [Bacteroidota bacterium]|nr:hypothetical protein [Bacteroidota bacterium]